MPKTTIDLTGKWEFKEYPASARRMRDLDTSDWLTTTVPGSIYTSLIEAGQINCADLTACPEDFSHISQKPWVYRKSFDVTEQMLQCDKVKLIFDGLDTIASIWLNEKLIAKTNNMFIGFSFDVKKHLKQKNNILLAKFDPPVQYAQKLMARYSSGEWDFTNPHRAYIRKAQYQFGWDFCPELPGCGIWRSVKLEGMKKAQIADVQIRTIECNRRYADVKIDVKTDLACRQSFHCILDISAENQKIQQNLIFEAGEDSHSTVIRIPDPHLWWPAGYGQANLYHLRARLLCDNEQVDQTDKKFGIRTVKLNRVKDKGGQNFQFEINGQKVFAKGANWVPASMFVGLVKGDDYQKLLSAAAKANMNMLRVWGGGYYESEHFYQLCDEMGIMVWQDFMFACAYYPDRKWFTELVKTEATEIIKRLRNHPSIVLWCGNNEIDQLHSMGCLGKSKKFYGREIYHKLLPQLLAQFAPDASYIPTTPLSEKTKFDANKLLTVHQWGVWSGHQPVREYLWEPERIPRFVTEFGVQSVPAAQTVKEFSQTTISRISAAAIEKHNYQADGSGRLYRYTADLFGPAENIEKFIYLSQITQGRAVKCHVEHLRAYNTKNNGVLFWQFNDCAPAISWSAIDYKKRPKALYYYARRFFADRLVTVLAQHSASLRPEWTPVSAVVINDCPQPLVAAVKCTLTDLVGNIVDKVSAPLSIAPFTSAVPLKLPRAIACPAEPEKSCLHLAIEKDGIEIAKNLFFYLPDKYIAWPNVDISKTLKQISDNTYQLDLSAGSIARDVQINTAFEVYLSDNFFDLTGGNSFSIKIDSTSAIDESDISLRSVNSIFAGD